MSDEKQRKAWADLLHRHERLGLAVAALNACADAQHQGTISPDLRHAICRERDRLHEQQREVWRALVDRHATAATSRP